MTTALPAYRAYLLRLWRTGEGQWRATLEAAHSGERLAFATLGELAAFLEHGEWRVAGDKPRQAAQATDAQQRPGESAGEGRGDRPVGGAS